MNIPEPLASHEQPAALDRTLAPHITGAVLADAFEYDTMLAASVTYRPKDLDTLRAQAPSASEQAFFRSDASNREIYGDTAWENFKKEVVSRRAVGEFNDRVRALKAIGDYSATASFQRARELKARADDPAASLDEQTAARNDLHALWSGQYGDGSITLSEYRTNLVGKQASGDIIRQTAAETLDQAEKLGQIEVGHRNWKKLVRDVVSQTMAARLTDILLACPDETKLSGFIQRSTALTSIFVGDLALNSHLESMTTKEGRKASESLQQLAHEYLNKALYPGYKVELIVGLGGSEDSPTFRLPAYITPALLHLQTFLAQGVAPPQLRIFHAHELASHINDLDPTIAQRQATASRDLLEAYMAEFFPDCLPYVTFDDLDLQAIQTPQFYEDRQWLKDHQTTPALAKALRQLMSRGEAHKGVSGTLDYAAAHASSLFNDYGRVGQPGPDATIKLGGSGEHNFNVVEQEIAFWRRALSRASTTFARNSAGSSLKQITQGETRVQPIFVTMKAGGKPPYYSSGEHELTLAKPPDSNDFAEVMAIYAGATESATQTVVDIRLLDAEHGSAYLEFFQNYVASLDLKETT
jgi:hypothetical protein